MNDEVMPEGWWTPAQVIQGMIGMTIDAARDRGTTFVLTHAPAFAPGASQADQDAAVKAADAMMLVLIAESEYVAETLDLAPDQRRRLIEDRVGACRARVFEMGARIVPGGSA